MIVITGALGFIGSNLLAAIQKEGYDDIVIVDTCGGTDNEKWRNIAKRSAMTLLMPDQLSAFLKDNAPSVEIVIHLGAISSTMAEDGDLLIKNNIQYTLDLYRFCIQYGVRFIYASSASVYGDGSNGFDDTEDAEYLNKLIPLNAYGWSKLFVDKYIFGNQSNKPLKTQVVGLRFFNVYGPNEYHKKGQYSIVYNVYEQLMQTDQVHLFKSKDDRYADGEQERDFVYVDDCVSVILWLIHHPEVMGLLNVGTGKAFTFREMATWVGQAMNKNLTVLYDEMPTPLHKCYQYHTLADIHKLRQMGYTKRMLLPQEGIQTYLHGYLLTSNPFK